MLLIDRSEPPFRVLRVVGYIRKSRVTMRDSRVRERAKAQGISMPLASLAIQTEDIELQVASERDKRPRSLLGFYQDVISGALEDRAGRNEIYRLAEAGLIDEVWVWAFDRWSREDAMEAISSVNALWKLGVKILSAEEPWIDPYGRKEDYEERVWEAFRRSNAERKRLILRSGRGLTRVKDQGLVLGHAPFGFRFIDPKDRWSGLEVDPARIDVLRLAFHMRSEGKSLKAISAATGLADSTLSFILHGSSSSQRDRSPAQADRLRQAVGSELFDSVQSLAHIPFPVTPTRAWALRGLCECPFCGRTMFGHSYDRARKDGTRSIPRRVYTCADPRKDHDWRSVPETEVLAHILAVLDDFVAPDDYADRVVEALRPKERVRIVFDRGKRESEINAKRSRAEQLYLEGTRDRDWFKRIDSECDREIAALPPDIALDEVGVRQRAIEMRPVADALREALGRPDDLGIINAVNSLLRAAIARIRFVPVDRTIVIEWQADLKPLLDASGAIHVRPALEVERDWVSAVDAARALGWDRRRLRKMLETGIAPGAVVAGSGRNRRWQLPLAWVQEHVAESRDTDAPADHMSVSEAVRTLGWSRSKLRKLLDAGVVPGARVTGSGRQSRWMIPAAWVREHHP